MRKASTNRHPSLNMTASGDLQSRVAYLGFLDHSYAIDSRSTALCHTPQSSHQGVIQFCIIDCRYSSSPSPFSKNMVLFFCLSALLLPNLPEAFALLRCSNYYLNLFYVFSLWISPAQRLLESLQNIVSEI
jgi:hypothetical protein